MIEVSTPLHGMLHGFVAMINIAFDHLWSTARVFKG